MTQFTVCVAPSAVAQITRYGRYFAIQRRVPQTAERWVDRIYDKIESLNFSPRRCPLAPENALRPYEVRSLIIGDYLALFTIDDATTTVHVIGFRHGHKRPLKNLPKQEPY